MTDTDKKLLAAFVAIVGLGFGFTLIKNRAAEKRANERLRDHERNEERNEEVAAIYEALAQEHPDANDEQLQEIARAPGGPLDELDARYRARGWS
jgi:hypothetical protein